MRPPKIFDDKFLIGTIDDLDVLISEARQRLDERKAKKLEAFKRQAARQLAELRTLPLL